MEETSTGDGNWSDHFSIQADRYSLFRPLYPDELYAWLTGQANGHGVAWDCGTGSGQVARGLAGRFERVIAMDASLRQLAHAEVGAGVDLVAGRSDVAPLRAGVVDLIGMGAAIHWFVGDAFYQEVRRVARPGALIAAWTYWLMDAGDDVTPVVQRFRRDVAFDWWPEGREWVENEYRTLPFPFDEIAAPQFVARAAWTVEHVAGYISTWSAVQRYRAATGQDPIPELRAQLEEAWGPDPVREIRWPLHMRVGFVQ